MPVKQTDKGWFWGSKAIATLIDSTLYKLTFLR